MAVKRITPVLVSVAATIALAIGINAYVPGFPNSYGDYGTSVPTSDASEPDRIMVEPLSPEDCDVAPRTLEEMKGILAAPPTDADFPAADPADITLDDAWIAELNDVLRTWQACHRFNNSLAGMRMESGGYIRRNIYPESEWVPPLSEETITEIFEGYLVTDAYYTENMYANTEADQWFVLVVDTSRPIEVSEDRTRIDLSLLEVAPVVGHTYDGGWATLVYEDGAWRIGVTGKDLLANIRYPLESEVRG